MKIVSNALLVSATDLANFSSCHYATALDLAVARKEREPAGLFNPMAAMLRERGLAHERRYVESLQEAGRSFRDLSSLQGKAGFEATVTAMQAGTHIIVQATLQRLPWNGIADVLLRCETPSKLGAWSYIPIDTKLARETRAATLLQLLLYAELLCDIQETVPDEVRVVVPGAGSRPFDETSFRSRHFDAYFRWIRGQMDHAMSMSSGLLESETYPEPVEHCGVCKWWTSCEQRRRTDDHLSLVAGATRLHRRELADHEVETLASLAEVPIPLQWKPARGSRASLERVREQARVQVAGRLSNSPVHELLPIEEGKGLARLPEPTPGDLFFDIEGDAFAGNGGREYLFGLAYRDAKNFVVYDAYWASTPAEERAAFEKVVHFIDQRRLSHPAFHVYHYAPYEPAALKRLMGRYASREAEIDQLLRDEKFVDLFRITRQSLLASVERYSIKDLEIFYGFARNTDLRLASQSRRVVEQAIEADDWVSVDHDVKAAVESYNRDDCLSALALRDWLESLRAEHEVKGHPIARPEPRSKTETNEQSVKQLAVQQLAERLMQGVPDDVEERTEDQKAKWLLAQELEFHHREMKVDAWEYYRLRDLDEEELVDERAGIAGLVLKARLPLGKRERTPTDCYEYPPQECEVELGADVMLPGTADKLGTVASFDRGARTLNVKKVGKLADEHPSAVFAQKKRIPTTTLSDSIERLGSWVAENGLHTNGCYGAALQLLQRRPPRLHTGQLTALPTEDIITHACRVARCLDTTVLPIQGPPGAGKTHTAARMICALVHDGKKIGVVANSHAVIHKLLRDVVKAGNETNTAVRCMARVKESVPELPFEQTEDDTTALDALRNDKANVVGGTAWFWAKVDAQGVVDVLFIDEAGQMSLANALAVSPAAGSVVLVGDPQQLDQPLKGSHPDGADVSALDHLLGEHETVREHEGIFLPQTWRLAPRICRFTSDAFYEGRLAALSSLENQRITGTAGFDGAGLWYVPAAHDGNQNSSPEEASVVAAIVERLLTPNAAWVDKDGNEQVLREQDILVVAPYNAHVARVSEALGTRVVRVATVDKFQGQEAPVVIYSMATSTPEDAPRGMDFLYSLNRLNVASSRARCACILVASPRLFEPECRSVQHMKLANAFCRYLELAQRITVEVRCMLRE